MPNVHPCLEALVIRPYIELVTSIRSAISHYMPIKQKASQRKERNWVDSIRDSNGVLYEKEEEVALVLTYFFDDLFSTGFPREAISTCEVVQGRVTPVMADLLGMEYTHAEVYEALKQIKPTAAPGPDGLPALFFYQRLWPIVGEEVTNAILGALNKGESPR